MAFMPYFMAVMHDFHVQLMLVLEDDTLHSSLNQELLHFLQAE